MRGRKRLYVKTPAPPPDLKDLLALPLLLDISRGGVECHFSPRGCSGNVGLGGQYGGFFTVSCKGMFNTSEEAKLELARHAISYTRKDYNGVWKIDGSEAARTRIGFLRRWIWCGYSETTMNDGAVFRVSPPVFGRMTPQWRNCTMTAQFAKHVRIHMYLARPDREIQFIFDRSESDLLRELPETTRAILLGEYLRVAALDHGGA